MEGRKAHTGSECRVAMIADRIVWALTPSGIDDWCISAMMRAVRLVTPFTSCTKQLGDLTQWVGETGTRRCSDWVRILLPVVHHET